MEMYYKINYENKYLHYVFRIIYVELHCDA